MRIKVWSNSVSSPISGFGSKFYYTLAGLVELGYDVKITPKNPDIIVDHPVLMKMRGRCAYVSVEGPTELKEIRAETIVASSRFVARMLGVEKVVPIGVPKLCENKEEEFDIGVVVSPSPVKLHLVRKGIDLYIKFLKRYRGRVICSSFLEKKAVCSYYTDDTVEIYSTSRLLLFLSRSEGFGLPVAEAMSCGTPVVYLDAPAVNEFACCWPIPARYAGIATDPEVNQLKAIIYEPVADIRWIVERALRQIINGRLPKVSYPYRPRDSALLLLKSCGIV